MAAWIFTGSKKRVILMPGADLTTRERILEFRLKLHLRLRNSWAEVKTFQPESLFGAQANDLHERNLKKNIANFQQVQFIWRMIRSLSIHCHLCHDLPTGSRALTSG